jgi:hypothetical protein
MVAYSFPSTPTEAWLVDVQPKGDVDFILFPHLKMIPLTHLSLGICASRVWFHREDWPG